MPNRIRGEAALDAGGKSYRLLLTLGALAEIEHALGLDSLADITTRLKSVRATDLAAVVAALLRGGGHGLSVDDVLKLPLDLGGLVAAVKDAFEAAGLASHSSSAAVVQNNNSPQPTASLLEAAEAPGADNHPFAGATG